MNEDDKDKIINILINGIDVSDFDFIDADKVIEDIIKFIHNEESEMFCWSENQNILFSKGNYTGEIFLELYEDTFLFKLTDGNTPYNLKDCGRFVSLILAYLGDLSKEKLDDLDGSRDVKINFSQKNKIEAIKNFNINDIKRKIKRITTNYYKK